jgi:hypothetical protein
MDALRSFLQRFYGVGVLLVIVGACVFMPIEVPLLAVWTGRATSAFNPLVVAAVLIGTVAHASTGLFTSALLARGEVNKLLAYKGWQLLLATALLAVATPIGLLPVAIALCVSLTLPAVVFNRRSAQELGLGAPMASKRVRWSLAAMALAQISIPITLILVLRSTISSWQMLGLVIVAAAICLAAAGALLVSHLPARRYWSTLVSWPPATPSPPAADHFVRK